MTVLRVLTVDDETLALRRLRLLLHGVPLVEHVGEASSCSDAIHAVEKLRPDVLLLDVRMRDGTGFDVLGAISDGPNPPLVIFVTAFDQFAVQAFENAIADYLLKPVERDRLRLALSRARRILRTTENERRVAELQEIVRNLRKASNGDNAAFETEFWLRGPDGQVRLAIDSVECVSSEDDYVAIHTGTTAHLMRTSLRKFETQIEPGVFVRVHRRWLVRKDSIQEIKSRSGKGASVLLRSGRSVPVGRIHLKALRRQLNF